MATLIRERAGVVADVVGGWLVHALLSFEGRPRRRALALEREQIFCRLNLRAAG